MPSPAEFEVDGVAYRCLRLSAARQFALLHLVTPFLPVLASLDVGLRLPNATPQTIAAVLAPLRTVEEASLKAVFDACLRACDRQDGVTVDRPSLASLIAIVMHVVTANFSALWAMERPKYDPVPTSSNDKEFGAFGSVSMPNGEDWLYAPVLSTPPLCRMLELEDGTYQIEHVAKMNDLLSVRNENEARLRYVAEAG